MNFTANHTNILSKSFLLFVLVRVGSWFKFFFLCSLFLVLCSLLYSQPNYIPGGRNDSEVAAQYVKWAQQAIDEGRMREALAALNRAADFSNVSSDITFLLAVTRLHFLSENETRLTVLEALETAIETNRWVTYNASHALLLKAEMLTALREYPDALACLDEIEARPGPANTAHARAEAAMQRLLVLRGMAAGGNLHALAQFRSGVLLTMDRFPRDPRPLRVFLEYARNKTPFTIMNPSLTPQIPAQFSIRNELTESDLNLMELVFRRLPFLIEADPELAWMAASFITDVEEARRLTASYRSGAIPHIQNRDFMPHPASIAVALNIGLLGDNEAVDALFSGSRGFNYPLAPEIAPDGNPVIDRDIINDVYSLLRSEEGRVYFTGKLLSFSGMITSDDDHDGYIDTKVKYKSGVIIGFALDANQDASDDLTIVFDSNGVPVSAVSDIAGYKSQAKIYWERYPFVQSVELNDEEFLFRPADFKFMPLEFIELGGSGKIAGFLYAVPAYQNTDLTRRTLILSCSILSCPSVEFKNGRETFYMQRGIPLKSEVIIWGEVLNGDTASITNFERGYPIIQHIDLDLDGRKETIRYFRRPSSLNNWDFRNYLSLMSSSESDWAGDGRYITKEVYREDGSVVYSFDIDGSGELNASETGNQR